MTPIQHTPVRAWRELTTPQAHAQLDALASTRHPHTIKHVNAAMDAFQPQSHFGTEAGALQEHAVRVLGALHTRQADRAVYTLIAQYPRAQDFLSALAPERPDLVVNALFDSNSTNRIHAGLYLAGNKPFARKQDVVSKAHQYIQQHQRLDRGFHSLLFSVIANHMHPEHLPIVLAHRHEMDFARSRTLQDWLILNASQPAARERDAHPAWNAIRRADAATRQVPDDAHPRLFSRVLDTLLDPAQARRLKTPNALKLYVTQLQGKHVK